MIPALTPAGAGRAAFALAGLCLLAAPAAAGALATVSGAEVELLSGAVSGETAEAGLEVRLAPGWKTYWRYPGDSGVPPQLSFAGSGNVRAVEIGWPAPKRFSDGGGGFSIGYKGTVLFPLKVQLADPARPARLVIAFDFAVCEALCLPAKVDLAMDIAPSGGPDRARILAARARLPAIRPPGAEGAPAITSVTLDGAGAPARLVIEARTNSPKADLFAEGPGEHWALPLPQKTMLPDGLARFVVPLEGVPAGVDPSGARLTLTLVDGPKAIETQVTVPAR